MVKTVKVMIGVVCHDCTASVLVHSCTVLHAAAMTLSDADTIAAHTSRSSGTVWSTDQVMLPVWHSAVQGV